MCGVIIYCAGFFPEFDTGSEAYQNFYYRVMVNTTYFPVGQFFTSMGLGMLGWTFVNVITLQRTDPFTSGNPGHIDFKKMLILTPIIFMYSTINAQRSTYALSSYCLTSASQQPEPTQIVYLNMIQKSRNL